MIPDRPGWWRARWKHGAVNPRPSHAWCCVNVEAFRGELEVWNEADGGFWMSLDAVEEWGARVWMPGDRA